MDALFPAVAGFARLLEDAVHRADGTQKRTFIQQGGLHSGRCAILEPSLMQNVEHLRAFGVGQRRCRRRPRGGRWFWLNRHHARAQHGTLPVETGARYTETVASGLDADRRSQDEDAVH